MERVAGFRPVRAPGSENSTHSMHNMGGMEEAYPTLALACKATLTALSPQHCVVDRNELKVLHDVGFMGCFSGWWFCQMRRRAAKLPQHGLTLRQRLDLWNKCSTIAYS